MTLVERDAELAALRSHLRAATAGEGRLVLVSGEAGVGKTTLVAAVRDETGGAGVHWGGCDAIAAPRPLGPLLDVISAHDELGDLVGHAHRHEIFEDYTRRLARRDAPALVVIEDLHWADEATLDLLAYLGRRVTSTRSLVVATYRDDELTDRHPLRLVLGTLATAPGVTRLRLLPLTRDGVAALVGPRGLDAGDAFRLSGGNPFIVSEMLAAPDDGLPPSVEEAVRAKAARLVPGAQHGLEAVALVPEGLDAAVVASLADEGATMDGAVELGLLVRDGPVLRFRHELARRAVESAVPPTRRANLHQRILTAMAASGVVAHARLAHHAEAAGNSGAVLRHAAAAAAEAKLLGSHREAATQYERVLRFGASLTLAERAEVLERMADEQLVTDRWYDAVEAYGEAAAIWRAHDDAVRYGNALRRLGQAEAMGAEPKAAWETLAAAVEVLTPLGPTPELAMALASLASANMVYDRVAEAIGFGERAMDVAERSGAESAAIHALDTVGVALLRKGDPRGEAMLRASIRQARRAGLDNDVARGCNNLGHMLNVARRLAEAGPIVEEGVELSTARQLDSMNRCIRGTQAMILLHRGRWEEAEQVAADVLDACDGADVHRNLPLIVLGLIRARRGSPDPFAPLDDALAQAVANGEPQILQPVRAARTAAALLGGDRATAAAEARHLVEVTGSILDPWVQGETAVLARRAGVAYVPSAELPPPYAAWIAGDHEAAAAEWAARECPYDEAAALTDSTRPEDLRRALARFDDLGAVPAAAAVARALRELGETVPRRPRRSTKANPGGLTPREAEIASLLAEHLTNDEIAARLYLSTKTVGHHVSSVLAKLGVAGRREVAARVAELSG